jgi:hypothetical protein
MIESRLTKCATDFIPDELTSGVAMENTIQNALPLR